MAKIIELPRADALNLSDLVEKLNGQRSEDPVALLMAGDEHLGTKLNDNNSTLFLKIVERVKHRLSGSIGDLVHNEKKLHQLNDSDWQALAYRKKMDKQGRLLPFITGNHCHHLYSDPEAATTLLEKKGGKPQNLSWLQSSRLLEEVVYGIAGSEVHYGPSAVKLGIVSQEAVEHKSSPGYFDIMVILIGKKLFFLRHGDIWDTWYARKDGRPTAEKFFKNNLAKFGSGTYDFLASFDTIGALKHAANGGVAKFVKSYFNSYRKVCRDIAHNSTLEALDLIEPWRDKLKKHGVTIGATFSGHTHLATRLTTNNVMHVNLGDCRGSMIGVAAVTESGEVLGPYEVYDDPR